MDEAKADLTVAQLTAQAEIVMTELADVIQSMALLLRKGATDASD